MKKLKLLDPTQLTEEQQAVLEQAANAEDFPSEESSQDDLSDEDAVDWRGLTSSIQSKPK